MSRIVTSRTVRTFSSASRPGVEYAVLTVQDDEGHSYLSCNCPAWTRGRDQKGKQAWERECKHTKSIGVSRPTPRPAPRPAKAARPRPAQPQAPAKAEPSEPSRFDLLEL